MLRLSLYIPWCHLHSVKTDNSWWLLLGKSEQTGHSRAVCRSTVPARSAGQNFWSEVHRSFQPAVWGWPAEPAQGQRLAGVCWQPLAPSCKWQVSFLTLNDDYQPWQWSLESMLWRLGVHIVAAKHVSIDFAVGLDSEFFKWQKAQHVIFAICCRHCWKQQTWRKMSQASLWRWLQPNEDLIANAFSISFISSLF